MQSRWPGSLTGGGVGLSLSRGLIREPNSCLSQEVSPRSRSPSPARMGSEARPGLSPWHREPFVNGWRVREGPWVVRHRSEVEPPPEYRPEGIYSFRRQRVWGAAPRPGSRYRAPGAPRFSQEHPGSPRSIQVHPGAPRFAKKHPGSPRSTQVRQGAPRFTKEHSGLPRSTQGHPGALGAVFPPSISFPPKEALPWS